MPGILDKCETILYADDTLIFTESETDEQCEENVKHDINKINTWLKMNKLKLNEDKTKIMKINMNSNTTFEINNNKIERVKSIKYLGFIIDEKLNFNEHMEYTCKKIGKKIGFFKRIRSKLSVLTSINIYNTIIKPHFEYGSTILYTCCNKTQLERLQKLQNKAMRAILKCNRYASIQSMLEQLQWLNIKQRHEFNTIFFIHKLKMGIGPQYLKDRLVYVGDVQPYDLRNASNFRLERVTSSDMQKSLFFKGLQLYNRMPNDIKNEHNFNRFKRMIVIFIRNNIM